MIRMVNIQGNIVYEPIDLAKEKLTKICGYMDKHYGNGTITKIGVPVSAPPEIPRLICQSANNHSHIQITGITGQLVTRFDDNYACDYNKCFQYCQERMESLKKALCDLGVNINFSGIIANYVCDDSLSSIDRMKDKTVKLDDCKVFDVLGTVTYVKSDVFYLNMTMRNLRQTIDREEVGISIDINDRYYSNFEKNSVYNLNESLDEIFDMHRGLANNKLLDFVNKGVFIDGN